MRPVPSVKSGCHNSVAAAQDRAFPVSTSFFPLCNPFVNVYLNVPQKHTDFEVF